MIQPSFRAHWLAPLLFVAAPALAASAEPRHLEAAGASLAISTPCAATVTIEPDPSLTDRVVLDATAQHPQETAQLTLVADKAVRLRGQQPKCWEPPSETDFQSTLAITLRVPSAMPVAIEEAGGAEYTIGKLQGAVNLDISGGVKLHADQVGPLSLDLSGGAVTGFGQIEGRAKIDVSGGGSVHIVHATLQDLTMALSGGGAFRLDDGTASQVTIDLSGAASVQIGGVVGDATVNLSGLGTVRFAKITGKLTKEVDGLGTVTVGQP